MIYDNEGDEYHVYPYEIGTSKDWEKVSGFDKYDLLCGDVVVTRNGNKYILFKNYAGNGDALVNTREGWMDLESYEDDLRNTGLDLFDIMEVYRPQFHTAFYPARYSFEDYECVFKREDRKKMTVEEIEAALGYKVAIVDKE